MAGMLLALYFEDRDSGETGGQRENKSVRGFNVSEAEKLAQKARQ